MSDKNTDEFMEDLLKQYLKKNKYYDADELYDAIAEKEKEFIKLLNKRQRIEFAKLRAMFERYEILVKQDSFANGFFKGIICDDIDV